MGARGWLIFLEMLKFIGVGDGVWGLNGEGDRDVVAYVLFEAFGSRLRAGRREAGVWLEIV